MVIYTFTVPTEYDLRLQSKDAQLFINLYKGDYFIETLIDDLLIGEEVSVRKSVLGTSLVLFRPGTTTRLYLDPKIHSSIRRYEKRTATQFVGVDGLKDLFSRMGISQENPLAKSLVEIYDASFRRASVESTLWRHSADFDGDSTPVTRRR